MVQFIQEVTNTSFSLLVYGAPGIGKTTFSTLAPKPVILNLENGLKNIPLKERGAYATNHITTLPEVIEALNKIETIAQFETVVIDSLTKLQQIIVEHVLTTGNKKTLQEFAYGSGYQLVEGHNAVILKLVEKLRIKKNVIFIAHSTVQQINQPDLEPYDCFLPDLDKRVAEKLKAYVDYIWFMKQERIVNADKKQSTLRNRILLQTKETGGVCAKSRASLPLFIEVPNDTKGKAIFENL